MKTSPYFANSVMQRRPYLTVAMCQAVVENPHRREVQTDGRVKFWGYVPDYAKWLRVVTLADEQTLFNAFFDRRYTP